MDLSNLPFMRERNRSLMPSYMSKVARSLEKKPRPSVIKLRKLDFILAWCAVFDSSFVSKREEDKKMSESFARGYATYHVLLLNEAFEWTAQHYAELDLGGNKLWPDVVKDALKLLKANEWNKDKQAALIAKYLSKTRWFDESLVSPSASH